MFQGWKVRCGMFVDRARIHVAGGKGGNGAMSFRREKYVPLGGPDGGDGGHGGDVVLEAFSGLSSLLDFTRRIHVKAGDGRHGMGSNKHGASGGHQVIRVPCGTVVKDTRSGRIIADLDSTGARIVVAKGGRGGRGNARFATPRRKAPRIAEKGDPGEERWIELELKVLADVGLIGYPNAGKSTLLGRISRARPKVASYPFTTVSPNLGVVEVEEGHNFVVADIPGLIEGAHTGAGMGHEFLRHIERTRLLIHVVDASGSEGRDPGDDFDKLNIELSLFNPALGLLPQVVAANKLDLTSSASNIPLLRRKVEGRGFEMLEISALVGTGVGRLVARVWDLLKRCEQVPRKPLQDESVALYGTKGPDLRDFSIDQEDAVFVVKGEVLERVMRRLDFKENDAVRYFQRLLEVSGVNEALKKAGAGPGDTVRIGETEFDFVG